MRDPLIIAHRGASADYPENTRDAFVGAAEQGADWVELDVRVTSGGSLIVHHDAWYHDQRQVYGTPVSDRPPAVLQLSEALDACAEGRHRRVDLVGVTPLGVNIEIKNSPGDLGGDDVPWSLEAADLVVVLVRAREAARSAAGAPTQDLLVSAFDAATIDRVRELGGPPTAQVVFDMAAWPEVVESTAARGHVALHPWDPFVDEPLLDRAHAAGLAVNTWTVDAHDRISDLAEMGVDGIVTNVPAAARRAVSGHG